MNATTFVTEVVVNGGSTASPWSTTTVPATGYMVGGWVQEVTVARESFSERTVHAFVQRNFSAFSENPSLFVGAWLNTETGCVHLDAAAHFPRLNEAEAAGRERGEIAIFDLSSKTEIRL